MGAPITMQTLTDAVRSNRFARHLVVESLYGALELEPALRASLWRWFDAAEDPLAGPRSRADLLPFADSTPSSSMKEEEEDDDDVFNFLSAPSAAPAAPIDYSRSFPVYPPPPPPPSCAPTSCTLDHSIPSSDIPSLLEWVQKASLEPRSSYLAHSRLFSYLLFTYSDVLRFHVVNLLLLCGSPKEAKHNYVDNVPIHMATRRVTSALYSAHFDLPLWAPPLAALTAASHVYALSASEARTIAHVAGRFFAGRHETGAAAAREASADLAALRTWADSVFQHVDAAMFCRLSTRSPKDAAFYDARFPSALAEERRQLGHVGDAPPAIESAAEHAAAAALLQVASADDVIRLLVTSKRAAQDVTEALDVHVDGEGVGVAVVLRAWRDAPIETEMRVFVRGGRPTAVCPTFAACFFGPRSDWADLARRAVSVAMEAAAAMPSRPDFVADVAFAAGDGAAFVVEMNAYGALLQGTLFDWEADQDVLYNGPIECRVRVDAQGGIDKIVL